MTMGPLVVFSFTRETGGAFAFSVDGSSRLGPAAFALVAALGAAALGAGLVCASAAGQTASIDMERARRTFFIRSIILTQIPNGSVRVLSHSLKAIFSP